MSYQPSRITLPPSYTTSRQATHHMAEHVLSAARHRTSGRIGLRPTLDGIATPPFGSSERIVGVRLRESAIELFDTNGAGESQSTPVSTVRSAASFLMINAGAPTRVFLPTTTLDLDSPIDISVDGFLALVNWNTFAELALRELSSDQSDGYSAIQLWPEHFDMSTDLDEVNFGASPGDDSIPVPYAYVGPWHATPLIGTDPFWNQPFGASLTFDAIESIDHLVDFYRTGQRLAAQHKGPRK